MNKWQDIIIKDFFSFHSKLTVVYDPDNLLQDDLILIYLKEQGYVLIKFDDHINFRYVFETNYRQFWDNDEQTSFIILVYTQNTFKDIPYDLYTKGRKLNYQLSDIFPKLSYPIIKELDKTLLNKLYSIYLLYNGPELTDTQTIIYVLKNLFNLDLTTNIALESLIFWFLHYYYSSVLTNDNYISYLPDKIGNFLIDHLKKYNYSTFLPIEDIINSKSNFFNFIQEQWNLFLNTLDKSIIPFDDPTIKAFIISFFLEGLLIPIKSSNSFQRPEWVKYGIITKESFLKDKIDYYHDKILKSLPSDTESVDIWLQFATDWLQYIFLLNSNTLYVLNDTKELNTSIEEKFETWVLKNFVKIYNLAYLPKPKMVHHIIHYLSDRFSKQRSKIALIVLDGMSFFDWFLIKEFLTEKDSSIQIEQNAVFAWIPSITNISRQAIFSGLIPMEFAPTIMRTDKDDIHWKKFWQEQNQLNQRNTVFFYNFDMNKLNLLKNSLSNKETAALGIIINTIDDIVHGSVVGLKGVQENIKIWLNDLSFYNLIKFLLDHSFRVFVTSDHGNTEALGIGEPQQGVLVNQKFKRARIYSGLGAYDFREQAYTFFPHSIKFPDDYGLPKDIFALMPKFGFAYTPEGSRIVTHGGISIEELIVPFIEIWRIK